MKKRDVKGNVELLKLGDIQYYRFIRDEGKIKRGSVLLYDDQHNIIIPEYPHIKRVYRLKRGVERFFKNEDFYVEEKYDGYNVRVFKYQNKILASTRGGIICPFTSEWINIWCKEILLEEFFKDYSQYILCVECMGDNPYNSKRDFSFGKGLFMACFDILNPQNEFLSPIKRNRILKQYRIPQIKHFGQFNLSKIDQLVDVILDLNKKGREGIVMKGTEGKAVKFVTPNSDLRDIKEYLPYAFDTDAGFFSSRLLRSSLFVSEFNLDHEKYSRKIGMAILNGYALLENYSGSHERFLIHVKKEETWTNLREILMQHTFIKTKEVKEVEIFGEKMLQVIFVRVHKKSTKRYKEIIKGYGYTD